MSQSLYIEYENIIPYNVCNTIPPATHTLLANTYDTELHLLKEEFSEKLHINQLDFY